VVPRLKSLHQQRNTKHQPNPKETIMNTTTMNKDNAGSTLLLAAMMLTIAAALFGSMNVRAAAVELQSPTADAAIQTNVNNVADDVLVVTATRLK
jgi:hypothetical protein